MGLKQRLLISVLLRASYVKRDSTLCAFSHETDGRGV